MLIDTHCHMNMMTKNQKKFEQNKENYSRVAKTIEESVKNSVTQIINIGTDLESSLDSIYLAQNFSEVFCAIGIHPCDATTHWKNDLKKIEQLIQDKQKNKIVAIGESGLDFYHPGFIAERQKDVFKAQIEIALKEDLPIVVHTRNAIDETLKILQEYNKTGLRGVIHCFSEDNSYAQEIFDFNFMIGIGGTITYPKNDYLRSVVKATNLSNVILETDAPFLPPQTIRGKQNHPASVRTIAEYIATMLSISIEEVAQKTTKNAQELFKGLTLINRNH